LDFGRKKDSRIFFWAIKVPQKKNLKNIEKTPYGRVAQKRYYIAPGAANHTFFDSPCIQSHKVIQKMSHIFMPLSVKLVILVLII